MHILVLTADLPFPPESGPQVKTYHLLRHLVQTYHVTLASFMLRSDPAAVAVLSGMGIDVHTVPLRQLPVQPPGQASRVADATPPTTVDAIAAHQMHDLLADLVQQARDSADPITLVHADQFAMAAFALGIDRPRLLDLHRLPWADLEGLAPTQTGLAHWWLQREIQAAQRTFRRVARGFDAITVVSEDDRRAIDAILDRTPPRTMIPLTVDPEHSFVVPRKASGQTILSLTSLNHATNAEGVRWFARDVYPLVRRQVPASRLDICGANPPATIVELALADPTIRVTGRIEDPRPFIYEAGCLIVPLRSGGGMRVTILEALARGIPVVATRVGCAELDLQSGRHLLVADKPSDFADAVSMLLNDSDLGSALAEAGRQRVVERYAWNVVCPAIDPVYTWMVQLPQRNPSRLKARLSD